MVELLKLITFGNEEIVSQSFVEDIDSISVSVDFWKGMSMKILNSAKTFWWLLLTIWVLATMEQVGWRNMIVDNYCS